jgi:hypothetical protein
VSPHFQTPLPRFLPPLGFVKKKRLFSIAEQLFRRSSKPLKEQQVIPFLQFKVLYLQQIVFF